ncbi:peptide chain release factor N(5)-glutamine methyltransferase [Alteribacillus bidgolensis]|uniref:Release factor glutamine methyltransferase n=1 Tax=Alteribacillus bidgolensis TaxID=930129 RepID=A0A1G8M393_9BACI|nr:peptide chain release factor N(5)-glutamine methyltransferase [Alteribacillus bidgolensis]SDI61840.1 release factor glutamine methyltransferase [Alteribacillus bidgolensis]
MKKPAFVYEALKWASSFLAENGREQRAADVLMRHHLQKDWTDFHLSRRDELNEDVWEAFQRDVFLYGKGIPVQHLMGYEEFFGRRFNVSEDVLIPRPETEELVEGVLSWLKLHHKKSASVADIGTGSGAIAVTLALEFSDLQVTAVELNDAALHMAEKNAESLQAEVSFLKGDLLEPLQRKEKKWDVIVSNPPYIPKNEWVQLDSLVKDHEPELALIGQGEDGLYCYRKMAAHLSNVLKKDGLAAFEIGEKQGKEVAAIFQKALPDAKVDVRLDINGKERMVFCERGRI